jgi:hypothetical protein
MMQLPIQVARRTLAVSFAVLLLTDCLHADVFLLENGGRIHGRWVNRQESPVTTYEIRTAAGGRLRLASPQVRCVLPQDNSSDSAMASVTDAVNALWNAAECCREAKEMQERAKYLRRILQLAPNHVRARHGLGYTQLRGRWVLQEEIQKERGLVHYEGRWRLVQHIELLEGKRAQERKQNDWLVQLTRWREMLSTDKKQAAYTSLSAVRDPAAVPALSHLLRLEPYRPLKLLYIDVLAEIADRPSIQTLVDTTLRDPDEEIFHACLDRIVRLKPPHVTERYVRALKDANNVRLNRAAYALGRLGDRTVLSPLIDALVTTHYIVIPGKSESYTTTFMNTSAPGSSPVSPASSPDSTACGGGDKGKVIPRTVTNQEVLDALIKLTGGVNFGLDEKAWRYWLATENRKRVPAVQSRRDED